MYCSKCGTENPDDSAFCAKCSNPLKEPSEQKGEQKGEQKKKSRLIWILVGGFLLLLVGCGVIFGLLFSGTVVPYPKDTLNLEKASVEILSVDKDTGDVRTKYTIPITNIGKKNLDKVILKDFELPGDILMEDKELVISELSAGETKDTTFIVIAKKGGFITQEKSWKVNFTIRVQIGSSYLEQGSFYFTLTLTP